MHSLKTTSVHDRPRERAFARGTQSLSDVDLIALVLGSGSQEAGVFTLAARVLKALDGNDYAGDPRLLMGIAGVGPATAAKLSAAIELGRRIQAPRHFRIRHPSDVLPLIRHYADRRQEHFLTIALNGAHEVIRVRVASVGLVNRTLVHPREVFAGALTDRATAIIVAHNHPSGNVEPSNEDRAVTETLVEAGDLLGIRVIDHVVFTHREHISFIERGYI